MRCVRELLMTSISMQAFWVLSYLEANELLIKHIQLSVKAGIISTSPDCSSSQMEWTATGAETCVTCLTCRSWSFSPPSPAAPPTFAPCPAPLSPPGSLRVVPGCGNCSPGCPKHCPPCSPRY